jgi:hypothetical protein
MVCEGPWHFRSVFIQFWTATTNEHQLTRMDSTSLPKRFFFRLLKSFYLADEVRDLLVTYSVPECYSPGNLSVGGGIWHYLPGFEGNAAEPEMLIVGAGFMVESLQQRLSDMVQHESIKILIPFPASLSALRRSWDTVLKMNYQRPSAKFENFRVHAHDMSAAFDRIVSLSSGSVGYPAFGPFGPKPMSAAMCLYALQRNSTVYYPQPTAYDPDYSKGTNAVLGYWIKYKGERLYDL